MHEDYGIPFPDEIKHLEETGKKLEEALSRAEESVKQADREYMDTKRYMAEHRGDIDPHEMFQNELLLKQTDRTGAFAVDVRARLLKLRDSPYFARIDFKEEHQGEARTYYIGRFAFQQEGEPLIFDWRAPVSGIFYDYEVGDAGFSAPKGWVRGKLTKKRQFKIRGGVMEYALESSSHVQDDVLQRELSHSSDEKMKSIISTIQKEQNQIIRNEKEGTMIIQGVAGSGKTSIALHRIAFLLYRFKSRLNAKNVTILSPNKVFGDYISGVIPELGEEPVYTLGFPELAKIQLEGVIDFELDRDPSAWQEEAWADRVRFKSTLEFVRQMDRYIRLLPEAAFSPVDYIFGRFTAEGEWIRTRFLAYETYPVRKRLRMVAEDIRDRFQTENIMEEEIPRLNAILKSLNSMLKIRNTLAAYKDFYKKMGCPERFVMPAKKTLEWADVYPFLYLHAAFEGLMESGITRHLVVDEMQDYTPVQYAALNRMFPCQKTILGDFGQSVNPNHLHSLSDLRALYGGAEFVELNKSYRSTYEIIMFAKRIRDVAAMEPVERHGKEPAVLACRDQKEEIGRIVQVIREFQAGGNATLGIILKTDEEAERLYGFLREALYGGCFPLPDGSQDLRPWPDSMPKSRRESPVMYLLTPQSADFHSGVSVTSVMMAKGLEFDEVLIPQADDKTYRTGYDRSLLYIACTRAMHRLTLTFTGKKTELIT